MPTQTHRSNTDITSIQHGAELGNISPLTVEKGLSFLRDIWHHNLVYIFREAWPAWWGAPALCCNL